MIYELNDTKNSGAIDGYQYRAVFDVITGRIEKIQANADNKTTRETKAKYSFASSRDHESRAGTGRGA